MMVDLVLWGKLHRVHKFRRPCKWKRLNTPRRTRITKQRCPRTKKKKNNLRSHSLSRLGPCDSHAVSFAFNFLDIDVRHQTKNVHCVSSSVSWQQYARQCNVMMSLQWHDIQWICCNIDERVKGIYIYIYIYMKTCFFCSNMIIAFVRIAKIAMWNPTHYKRLGLLS